MGFATIDVYFTGCHAVIALTHMRTPNDVRLAEEVDEIDLILGGHDHVYEKKMVRILSINQYKKDRFLTQNCDPFHKKDFPCINTLCNL